MSTETKATLTKKRKHVRCRGELLAEALYTREGIKEAIGIGDVVLMELRRAGGLKARIVGGRVYFLGAEIIAAIKKLGEKEVG